MLKFSINSTKAVKDSSSFKISGIGGLVVSQKSAFTPIVADGARHSVTQATEPLMALPMPTQTQEKSLGYRKKLKFE